MNRTTLFAAASGIIVAAALGVGGWAWSRDTTSAEQDHPTAAELVVTLKSQLNDEQQALLADGVLTRAEYQGALDRVVICLEADGQTVHRLPGRGVGGVDEISSEWDDASPSHRQAVLDCYEKHTGRLGIIWAEQNRPTAEQLAERAASVNACMVSGGLTAFNGKPLSAYEGKPEELNTYLGCLADAPVPGRP